MVVESYRSRHSGLGGALESICKSTFLGVGGLRKSSLRGDSEACGNLWKSSMFLRTGL